MFLAQGKRKKGNYSILTTHGCLSKDSILHLFYLQDHFTQNPDHKIGFLCSLTPLLMLSCKKSGLQVHVNTKQKKIEGGSW